MSLRIAVIALCITACSHTAVSPDRHACSPLELSVTGGNETMRSNVMSAVLATDSVWRNEHFWALVEERKWLPSPTGMPIDGHQVAKTLRTLTPSQAQYKVKNVPSSVFRRMRGVRAMTPVCGTVSLYRHAVGDMSALVNTIIHENTHRFGDSKGQFLYSDTGHDDSTRPWLVSYALGDLAQCFYDADGNKSGTIACFNQRINAANGVCRRWKECRAGELSKVPENLKEIRQQAGCAEDCGDAVAFCAKCGRDFSEDGSRIDSDPNCQTQTQTGH